MPHSEPMNWQPISQMPLIAGMIADALTDTRDQLETLTKARARPHVLDDATIDRTERIYGEQLQFVDIYAQQIRRWRSERPSADRTRELDRMEKQNRQLQALTANILELARELRKGAIDRIMETSDLELGLQALLGKHPAADANLTRDSASSRTGATNARRGVPRASAHDLVGLVKFLGRDDWKEPFETVLGEHFSPALDAFDLDEDEIGDVLGEHWAMTLWGCAFEDFLTRTVEPDGRNLVDAYLKRRGWKEGAQAKAYMKALRTSVMSLYEVSEIQPGQSFLARDLIRGGEPALVHEATATQTLKPWERIAMRIVPMRDRQIIAGGLLPFSPEACFTLLGALSEAIGQPQSEGPLKLDDNTLRTAAPLFTNAWTFDVLSRVLGEMPIPTNRDGEELVFHQLRFPLAKVVRQKDVVARLGAVEALTQDGAKFWNWLVDRSAPAASSEDSTADSALVDLTTPDGSTILGQVELKGRFLILTTGSVSRAVRGRTLLEDALGDRLLAPEVRIETLDDFEADASLDEEMLPDIPPEIATPLVHQLLDQRYREALDEPVSMIGGVSPRAAINSAGGREKVAQWLKYLENQSASLADPRDPVATYDFAWIWRELGVESLRR
ncbi:MULTISPECIES: hypothetical protein [unclassified Aurantimonas]|uniref:hypothetical protein n=1 Tax=unclassified Aurantimonas TaxID=2638230 RepID=UPI002E16EEAF|nr:MULTISPECIES: hypothetical protein [unclassified Aurantimonas]MEC5293501.1 hypothetical protein [Aurantimonas sp. C2-3-R2]MEC5414563.1 hypothetical protein [Aurantimonas sp. C2-4-R8]